MAKTQRTKKKVAKKPARAKAPKKATKKATRKPAGKKASAKPRKPAPAKTAPKQATKKAGKGAKVRLTKADKIGLLKRMMEIRGFEDKVFELLGRNVLKGASHVYAGQEAVAVGACSAMTKRDYATSAHRGHGHCLALGGDLKLMMAELCGKATGYCKGRGGSMHIADVSNRNLGATGIVGGNLPVATGAGLALQMQGTDSVCLCFFGDGASNEGAFHESLNMAGKWQLPVVYICENNQYGMSVAFTRACAVTDVCGRAHSYNMPGAKVDGQNVLEVRQAVLEAIERARRGDGPSLIEAVTYRYRGHSRSDPRAYRTREEESRWQKRDPIILFKQTLVDGGMLTEDAFTKLQATVDQEIADAETYAVEESPYPDPSEVLDDVYCGWIETKKGLVRTETKG